MLTTAVSKEVAAALMILMDCAEPVTYAKARRFVIGAAKWNVRRSADRIKLPVLIIDLQRFRVHVAADCR
ncbi:MAG: hypothetical protein ACI9SX_000229 [Pseudoalteromonas tetraodonis]